MGEDTGPATSLSRLTIRRCSFRSAQRATTPKDCAPRSRVLGASWDEEQDRADMLAFDPEGKGERVYATAFAIVRALRFSRERRALVRRQRARRTRRRPAAGLCDARRGGRLLWLALVLLGDHQDPRHQGERADLASRITTPDQPHSAPLGITFYAADQFPSEYRGDAFVTLHGSWKSRKAHRL
jgi:hypothetical protein